MEKFDTKLDRYAYSAIVDRPTYEWPNGTRLAVYFALNIEAFEFGLNPGKDFTSSPSAPYHRGYAYRDYGNRVGVWRIKKLFDDMNMPLAILANSSVYDVYPRVLDAFRERGDEFVGHGRTNSERQIEMSETQEREMIAAVASRMSAAEGTPPKGWLGPFISQSPKTPELLKEQGFTYMLDWFFDDQPVWFKTDNGPILAVPYPSMELNDLPAYINRGSSDSDFTRMMIDAFDEQLEESATFPSVYCVSLHTFMTGHPHRIRQLRGVLEHIQAHRESIWLTTPGQIATHVAALPKGTVPGDER
ncbi:polysaccharide deacetylase family protein [Pusillimonas sp. SM2304]|uniref:polysaccharide deacetylase family protein n=1 Tax=Pusillimonas sp. SM2304 TaxID=3073241 RepID=UPI002875A599|nr:polysaccharide deacetylase family protein [Pusillimonas sp. SM2304]MDS1138827.1 polysaccharide deacetylase family protein [Pusillimonas sp. SM2304]